VRGRGTCDGCGGVREFDKCREHARGEGEPCHPRHPATRLDPATNITGGANLSLMNAIFGGLMQIVADEDGSHPRVVGVLAESFDMADGGRTLRIHLRQGVTFSDGTPFDAEAVRFNMERNLASPCSCSPKTWPWPQGDPVSVVDAHPAALHF
jgi:peptide/nickel transport system substrate-binding protein